MSSFYSDLSILLTFLTTLSSGNKRSVVKWNIEAEPSFELAKQRLLNIKSLYFPDMRVPLTVTTDASNIAIGAMIN